ncbi:MAG: hypothetical protein PGN09_14475 [Sphingomonas fennica]
MNRSALTLNIDNILKEDPPFRNLANGYAQRADARPGVVTVGVRTKF